MDFKKELDAYKKTDYTSTFDQANDWLGKQGTPSKKVRIGSIYKVAASLLILSLGIVACSLPVDQKEELGYTVEAKLKVDSQSESVDWKKSMDLLMAFKSGEENPTHINYNVVGTEEKISLQAVSENPENLQVQFDVLVVLPEAGFDEANRKKEELASILAFDSIKILPIEGEVERPLYQAALNSLEIVETEVPVETVVEGINSWMYGTYVSESTSFSSLDSIYVVQVENQSRTNKFVEIEATAVTPSKYKFVTTGKMHKAQFDSVIFELMEMEKPTSSNKVREVKVKGVKSEARN